MKIRLYNKSQDLDTIMDLFYRCVHEINASDYEEDELDAMAPKNMDHYHWESSLDKNHTIVAIEDDHIVGFGNIGQTGFLDRLYVDKDYLGRGIAGELAQHLEDYAKAKGNHIVNVYSPITAQKFFEKRGYDTIEEVVSEKRGVRIFKYLMEKKLQWLLFLMT